jgi:hypothetical protein
MKTFLVRAAFTCLMLHFLSSCHKSGISGCTDPNATNYYSSATVDDGTCKYAGNLIFWTSNLSLHYGTITVTLDNGQSTTITQNSATQPACSPTTGGTIMQAPTGSHTYTTKDGLGATTSGTITVSYNLCTGKMLN